MVPLKQKELRDGAIPSIFPQKPADKISQNPKKSLRENIENSVDNENPPVQIGLPKSGKTQNLKRKPLSEYSENQILFSPCSPPKQLRPDNLLETVINFAILNPRSNDLSNSTKGWICNTEIPDVIRWSQWNGDALDEIKVVILYKESTVKVSVHISISTSYIQWDLQVCFCL